MAQSYFTTEGELIIPGAYTSIIVQTAASGLAATGIVALVGEADGGPAYSDEAVLNDNSFGPTEAANVIAKYQSGNLVDAFMACASPANDERITGSPTKILIVKTNASTKASGALKKYDLTSYGTLADKSYGALGNLLYFATSNAVAEVIPTTGAFAFVPPIGTINMSCRVDGGAAVAAPLLGAAGLPNTFVSNVNGLAGVYATGGVNRAVITVIAGTLTVSDVLGNSAKFTHSVGWDVVPTPGDSMFIPITSPIPGAGNTNCGGYVITAADATTITATKVINIAVIGSAVTPPIATGPFGIAANTDLMAFSPVVITLAAPGEAGPATVPLEGIGRALEINELTTGTDLLSRLCWTPAVTAVTWISKTGAPKLSVSSAERKVTLTVNREKDSVSETLSAGGDIALRVGYTGTTGTVTTTATAFSTTVVGGTGSSIVSTLLSGLPTIADLAAYINAQPGYSAAVGSAAMGARPSTDLDRGTFGICSQFGVKATPTDSAVDSQPGRIKRDAQAFYNKIVSGSAVVQLGTTTVARRDVGIPGPIIVTDPLFSAIFMSGGAKGATLAATIPLVFTALEKTRCNFVVPLFSQNASADIVDGLTEAASTYTIAAIHAAARSHVLAMSTLKRRKNRLAVLSHEGSYTDNKAAAATVASSRCAMTFQDVKTVQTSTGLIVQFQPWMGAVFAAGMQAAGFYRAIVGKGVNCSGVIHADGSYDPLNDTDVEDALTDGLLPMTMPEDGGIEWVSDQMTYSKDNSFMYNSLQAMYVADIMAMSLNRRLERAFKGESVADTGAANVKSYMEGMLEEFLRNKLIAPATDAPRGYKGLSVSVSGVAILVEVEVKLAGAIYFIPIKLSVAQTTQSA